MINAKIKSARFKKIQTIENFNFSHSKYTLEIQKKYLELYESISSTELPSAIFTGGSGVGKTHLARSLGYATCQKGLSTLFITVAEMVNHLTYAQKTFNLESELQKYKRPQILILDELGYVSMDPQASNLFFQVISQRHDQELGTIATTNISFGKFNQIFANDAIAHSIIDRLVTQAEIFFIEGPSYREYQKEQKRKSK
jgi:DNA replication protein DnaC